MAIAKGRFLPAVAVAAAVTFQGCSLPFIDRWTSEPAVVVQPVPADPDVVWEGVADAVQELGLVVAEIRPEQRTLRLTWVTAPGDGRRYLRCSDNGRVGSASLRPRIVVRRVASGSEIEISSAARATAGTGCVSTGAYERWLLDQLGPNLAAVPGS